MDTRANGIIQELEAQRNLFATQAANYAAEIAVLREQVKKLEAELETKKPSK